MGDGIVHLTSEDPRANNINGHEVVDRTKYADGGPANDDLQYACPES